MQEEIENKFWEVIGGYHMSFTEGYSRVGPSYHKSKFINVHYRDCVGKYIPRVILIPEEGPFLMLLESVLNSELSILLDEVLMFM